jgi:coenzyme F420-dependent glucose-6-phosphate dehydrogenase
VPQRASFAGRVGDGLITVGGQELEFYPQLIAQFEEGVGAAGKDPLTMLRAIELNLEYVEWPEDAGAAIQNHLTYWAGAYVPALYHQEIYTPAMAAQNVAAVGPARAREKGCVSADPQRHARFIASVARGSWQVGLGRKRRLLFCALLPASRRACGKVRRWSGGHHHVAPNR